MMTRPSQAHILPSTKRNALDLVQLKRLEQEFRTWSESGSGINRKFSRKRVLLIFLLIRYSGARLNEILSLDLTTDIDYQNQKIKFRKYKSEREVQMPELLSVDLQKILSEFQMQRPASDFFKIDPAHVRRKFYERAETVGISPKMGTPEVIRKSRAVELMQSSVPLPVVQRIMGHSTPNLAASYVEFSEEELRKAERFYLDLESKRKTSARNSFFGKIDKVLLGDVLSGVEIVSIDGQRIYVVVTNFSQKKLGLIPGRLVAAEVKAPWIVLYKGSEEPACTADNRFKGSVVRILEGKVHAEIVVQISGNIELCAVLTEKSRKFLELNKGDEVWAAFNASSVVIHTD